MRTLCFNAAQYMEIGEDIMRYSTYSQFQSILMYMWRENLGVYKLVWTHKPDGIPLICIVLGIRKVYI